MPCKGSPQDTTAAFAEPQNLLLFQAGLRHSLDQLRVVMDVAVQPELGMEEEEEAPCEESPLLSSGGTLNKAPVTCSELLRLIPEGPPEVRTNIPLTEAPNHPPQGISAPKLIPATGDTSFFSSRSTWKSTHTSPAPALPSSQSCLSSWGLILEEFTDWAFPCWSQGSCLESNLYPGPWCPCPGWG